jgi:putative transposase
MRFEFIAAQRLNYPLPMLCRVLGVSVSGYYAWRKRPVSQRTETNQVLVAHIKAVHRASYETYGSPRVHAELVAQGYVCGRHRIARLMRQHGIQAKQGRRRRLTTIKRAGDPVAPNLLDRQFTATAPNQKWLADITFIPTQEGDLYLAPVLDLYARKIVGWAMDTTLKSELVQRALQMALRQRRPAAGLLHHSDQGGQYTSQAYQRLLKNHHCQVSMSRVSNCYDNAPMESFFGTLKSELLHHRQYRTRAEAQRDIFAYIEGFYNRRRRHSALGYQSPEQFEQAYYLSLN